MQKYSPPTFKRFSIPLVFCKPWEESIRVLCEDVEYPWDYPTEVWVVSTEGEEFEVVQPIENTGPYKSGHFYWS